MPLVMECSDGIDKPTILCDQCGQPILDARDGNYRWFMSVTPTENRSPICFTHKACCHAFDLSRRDVLVGAMELNLLPVYLVHNLNVNWPKANRIAALLAYLG